MLSHFIPKGCFQISKALCIPPVAVLGGLITLTSYLVSPAVVKVPDTEWAEKVLVWISINMPTGSTKSALYQYIHSILVCVRAKCGLTSRDPAWLLGDATCEKMGDLMAANGGRLLGLYDELSTFLTQLNLYKGKGLAFSHELALFLQLYNGHSWTRSTGIRIQVKYTSTHTYIVHTRVHNLQVSIKLKCLVLNKYILFFSHRRC